MYKGDMPTLKRLVNAHPELVRLTPEQTEAMAKMAAATDRGRIEERYVLSLLPDYTVNKGEIERSITTATGRNWHIG